MHHALEPCILHAAARKTATGAGESRPQDENMALKSDDIFQAASVTDSLTIA